MATHLVPQNSTRGFPLSSLDWRSEMGFTWLTLRCPQGHLPLGAPGENLDSRLFRLLEAACTPWLVAPSSVFKASSAELRAEKFCDHIPLQTLTLLFPSHKDPCDFIGSLQTIQDNLPIAGSSL